ncbi:MAG: hypothetical protein ACKOVA_00920 [Novosphingobium sp.]
MNKALMLSALAAATLTGACTSTGYDRPGYANGDEWGYYDQGYYAQNGRYDYNSPDPRYGDRYDADRYYRNNGRYRERQLSYDDRVYRGRDNRYYCRRSDGSTGLIIGGLGGAAVGAAIAPGDSRPLGAIIGAIGGAAVGAAVDSGNRNSNSRSNVRCR